MQKEYADCEMKMRRLREQHSEWTEKLGSVQSAVKNPRGLYQEMDDTANELKGFEKDAAIISEKSNRLNVIVRNI